MISSRMVSMTLVLFRVGNFQGMGYDWGTKLCCIDSGK